MYGRPEQLGQRCQALSKLIGGIRISIPSYEGNQLRPEDTKSISDILKDDSVALEPEKIIRTRIPQEALRNYAKRMSQVTLRPDVVVPIGLSGFEPGIIAAAACGAGSVLPIRYFATAEGRYLPEGIIEPRMPKEEIAQLLKDAVVLIVDDICASGITSFKAAEWAQQYQPRAVHFSIMDVMGSKHDKPGTQFTSDGLIHVQDLSRWRAHFYGK